MKKYVKTYLLLIISFTLISCGIDTSKWPRLSIPFEENKLIKVTINYDKKPYGSDSESMSDFLELTNKDTLKDIYSQLLEVPYKEKKESKINTDKYWIKLNMTMFYIDDEVTKEYEITFYSYGVTEGYLILDNGDIHYHPGDFVSAFYEYYLTN